MLKEYLLYKTSAPNMSNDNPDNKVQAIYAPLRSGTRWDPQPSDMGAFNSGSLYRTRNNVPNGAPVVFPKKSVLSNSMIYRGEKDNYGNEFDVNPIDLKSTWRHVKDTGKDFYHNGLPQPVQQTFNSAYAKAGQAYDYAKNKTGQAMTAMASRWTAPKTSTPAPAVAVK